MIQWRNSASSNIKLKDWENEREQRLTFSDDFNSFNKLENRKLKYKFEDLEAIIFGMKISMDDKAKIIEIIESKCKANNRTDFKFYQAYYSASAGSMQIMELTMFA